MVTLLIYRDVNIFITPRVRLVEYKPSQITKITLGIQKVAKKILTIGFGLANDDVQFENFTSKTSLLDWDIILFKPVIDDFISYSENYQGKPSLSDSSSFRLKESSEHWRHEIWQAIETGKTVIVYLSEMQDVYIDTGQKTHSGTGRNQKTTRLIAPFNNYNCIPADLKPTSTTGSSIKLSAKGAEILSPYWSEFEEVSKYNVILTAEKVPTCLVTKNGEKPVGALYRSKNSNGSLLCLPNIDFYPDDFLETQDGEEIWTSKAEQFAARLLSAVVSIDTALHNKGEVTPEPIWATDSKYSLEPEDALRVELLEAEQSLQIAQNKKELVLEKLKSAGRLRGLLYEKGKPLESSIIDALKMIGFQAKPYKDAESEFDVVFESSEGRFIGEAEGKDSKAVNVDKLRQLSMNIHEDLQREEINTQAKGVLFGNGYRLQPVEARDVAFTEKCISASLKSSTALIPTSELFKVVQFFSATSDDEFAAACRKLILESVGVITFSLSNSPLEQQLIEDKN